MAKKEKNHFLTAMLIVSALILIFSLGFLSESAEITGKAIYENSNLQYDLALYESVEDLGVLAPGNYFIDHEGIVFWTDDDSRPAIGKVAMLEQSQGNRHIYIDMNGNVGYLFSE